jgi:hypothetical protein
MEELKMATEISALLDRVADRLVPGARPSPISRLRRREE